MISLLKDSVVDPLIQFVQQYINDPDWSKRQAALLAMGSAIDGPSQEKIVQILGTVDLNKIVADPSTKNRNTAAWALYKLAKCAPQIIFSS